MGTFPLSTMTDPLATRPKDPAMTASALLRTLATDPPASAGAGATEAFPDVESTPAASEESDLPEPVQVDETSRVAEELLEDMDEAPLVGELAEAPEEEKERMAELRARHLVEEFEAEQAARHARFQES